ncbi:MULTISPECIES: preprotein translocase subunit SecG [unclassified Variovorax]|jgi:preprotein translocase subunit SecG|uniref:preprotein translocase subunit SecG n=1 Tax=unclassified Variovorax TaxID=663243 RepID=UPI000F7E8B62|nr:MULTISPECIES: preprotein translocase subunit SecG [unclassified Variovorax]RSZ39846.1 preprotein translocase subunit SecG [Variovorax sp. 553]RSZ40447.1 preprotein translocase subunit SecG [Variovorax sp. 679]
MNLVLNLLVGVQMLAALAMIGLILIQHGKGADMGAAFGSGSAGSLFGASGSANFLSRTTAVLAAVFFACTLLLAYFSHARPAGGGSLLERAAVGAPAAPASSGAAGEIPGAAAPSAPASAPAAPVSAPGQIPSK